MLKHWNWILAIAVIGIGYFGYTSQSFVGLRIRRAIDPLVSGIVGLVQNLLGA